MHTHHCHDHRGLTLTELLLVVAIVALLVAILLPALARHRCDSGNKTQCLNNLHQLGIALHDYANIHRRKLAGGASSGQFPAGTIPNANLEPDQRLSWVVELLPFLEEDALYRQFDRVAGWDAPVNLPLSQTRLGVLRCPRLEELSSPQQPWETAYVGMAGLGRDAASRPLGAPKIGAFGNDRQVSFADVKDGTSNTLMVLESARDPGSWAQGGFATVRGLDPEDKPYLGVIGPFGGTHCIRNKRGDSFGSMALWMDGSGRILSDEISPKVLEALVTIAGGEEIPKDYYY